MAEIVNNDKLTLILTQYGLDRVAEVMADPSLNLHLTKIKFGSGNNYEYYNPSEAQVSLRGPILEAEFYIYKKELLEDNLTVSFYTMIPENIGGFDIREVGLYETVNDVDYLFAVGTCQPFVKPTTTDNYFINIDYYIFLRAANFASVYEQITLDSQHALVTEPDMEEMLRTFLFADANLINQIGQNSRIIGYNRATQLYERISANKTSYSYITLYKNYASLLGMSSNHSIFSFWPFDYSRRTQTVSSIVDLSQNSNYLSTTIPVQNIEKVYEGFMSMFKMDEANFFLSSDTPVQLFNSAGNDIPFVIAFAVKPLNREVNRTLLAKSNYAQDTHTFEFKELANGSLQVKLFTDSNNYLTFTSNVGVIPETPHCIVLSYDPIEREFTAYLNSEKISLEKVETGTYIGMRELPGTLYYFSCVPTYIGYADSAENPTVIYNEDGSPYTGSQWVIANNVLNYEGHAASSSPSSDVWTSQLYAWMYFDGEFDHYIYTKVPPSDDPNYLSELGAQLYNADYTPYEGIDWYVNGYIIQYRGATTTAHYDAAEDINKKELHAWKYEAPVSEIYGNKPSNPTSLYTFAEKPTLYEGEDWIVTGDKVYYLGQVATYDSSKNSQTGYPDLTSYVTDITGHISEPINSEVGLISIVKDDMEEERVKALALLLCATMGMNPYIGG